MIKVGIYDGDALKWQETFPKIFSKGVFSEVIGIQNPITEENINLTSAKLGFVIDDGPVQFVRVTAVSYALHARFAKTAENIPAATATFLGGIKVESGLAMDSNGVLSVSSSNYNYGVSINGTVKATSFVGDGSRLTNLTVASGSPPMTVTTTPYQMYDNTHFLIVNNSASPTTILLPNHLLSRGRVIKIKTIQAISVISMTPTLVPLNSATAGTAILSGGAGKWAELVCDRTNWVIMSTN